MTAIRSILVTMLLVTLAGCGDGNDKKVSNDKATPNTPGPAVSLPADLLVSTTPGEAKNIVDLKKDAKEGDEVVVRGVVGGDTNPFVANRAMVSLIDMAVPTCKENGEECPTPWDYCCVPQEELTKAKATVQVVGKNGFPLKVALSSGQKLKPYDVIVVRGKVGARPSGDVLVVNATSIYVEGSKK